MKSTDPLRAAQDQSPQARPEEAYPVSEVSTPGSNSALRPDSVVTHRRPLQAKHAKSPEPVSPSSPQPPSSPSSGSSRKSVAFVVGTYAAAWAVTLAAILVLADDDTTLANLPKLISDVATGARAPITAQDRPAAAVLTLLLLLPLFVCDVAVCQRLCNHISSHWFLLHAIANLGVVAFSIPDFVAAKEYPMAMLSVAHCETLSFPACSDLPVCLIIAIHAYHMICFSLSSDDLFHHLVFVPAIAGTRFFYPWGAGGNILPFFISGLPGGIDYVLLALVKEGRLSSLREKRINCSINTWLRLPGIVGYLALTTANWLRPLPGTPPEHLMPGWMMACLCALIFFNGGHYAQRVIGNYYLTLQRENKKHGIERVELHAS